MKTRSVYQTVEDRGNPDEIERFGPFLCSRRDAWLGNGYYFWESFVDNAHWWGKRYPSGYIICEASYVNNEEKCLDLNTPEGLHIIESTESLLKGKIMTPKDDNVYVSRLIEFLKEIGHFKWEAVRVTPVDTNGNNSPHGGYRVKFDNRYGISLRPAIQICFYSKTALQLSGYKIIYPDEYVEGYVV